MSSTDGAREAPIISTRKDDKSNLKPYRSKLVKAIVEKIVPRRAPA